jgi:hypothetical protein
MAADVSLALTQARASLQGFARFGPSFWPCARYFVLATIDAEGDTDGGNAEVCRSCVIKVAVDALYVLDRGAFAYEQVIRFNVQDGQRTTALEACGPAPLYEIWGVTDEPPPDTRCADCGHRLVES